MIKKTANNVMSGVTKLTVIFDENNHKNVNLNMLITKMNISNVTENVCRKIPQCAGYWITFCRNDMLLRNCYWMLL